MKTNDPAALLRESVERNKQYHINTNIPVVIKDGFISDEVDLDEFVHSINARIPGHLLQDVEMVYIGEFPELAGRNAAFLDGAIYISNEEPTTYDMLEDAIHEIAHSIEISASSVVYEDGLLEKEFLSKREKLKSILDAHGYEFPERLYYDTEYRSTFDEFLYSVVGYPTLLTLTIGLFASPYGATSLREYFANGFEKYYLGNTKLVKDVSPVLYNKLNTLHTESER
jgi:hypothetical protein